MKNERNNKEPKKKFKLAKFGSVAKQKPGEGYYSTNISSEK